MEERIIKKSGAKASSKPKPAKNGSNKKSCSKSKTSFTIFELRDYGSKLFESKNKKFNSLVDSVARELNKDNYGNAHDFANMNLNNEEFNGTEQGCLGAICGCITAYLVGLHLQQREECSTLNSL